MLELVVLIAITGIAAAGIVTLYGAISSQRPVTDEAQRGVLMMEACAETLLASRRLLTQTYSVGASSADTARSCSTVADGTRTFGIDALCECHRLLPASLTAEDLFSPYEPRVTVIGVAPVVAPAVHPSTCYRSPDGGTPRCIQVRIEALRSGTPMNSDPVFLQLQEYD